MLKSISFYISLISILPFLLFGCNSATQEAEKAAPRTETPTPSSSEVSNTIESPSPVESTPAVGNVGWAMPTEHIQPKQKDFKAEEFRRVGSAHHLSFRQFMSINVGWALPTDNIIRSDNFGLRLNLDANI
jgi:hypothetical protein